MRNLGGVGEANHVHRRKDIVSLRGVKLLLLFKIRYEGGAVRTGGWVRAAVWRILVVRGVEWDDCPRCAGVNRNLC